MPILEKKFDHFGAKNKANIIKKGTLYRKLLNSNKFYYFNYSIKIEIIQLKFIDKQIFLT